MHRAPTILNGEACALGISRATRPCDRARRSAAMPRLPRALTRCDGSCMHAHLTSCAARWILGTLAAGGAGRQPIRAPCVPAALLGRSMPQRARGEKQLARPKVASARRSRRCRYRQKVHAPQASRDGAPGYLRRRVCCALRWQLGCVCKLRLTYAMMC